MRKGIEHETLPSQLTKPLPIEIHESETFKISFGRLNDSKVACKSKCVNW